MESRCTTHKSWNIIYNPYILLSSASVFFPPYYTSTEDDPSRTFLSKWFRSSNRSPRKERSPRWPSPPPTSCHAPPTDRRRPISSTIWPTTNAAGRKFTNEPLGRFKWLKVSRHPCLICEAKAKEQKKARRSPMVGSPTYRSGEKFHFDRIQCLTLSYQHQVLNAIQCLSLLQTSPKNKEKS